MTKQWELHDKDGARIAGPVFASSKGGALSRVRDELGRKRLPNGSELIEVGGKSKSKYQPPFTVSRHVNLHHTVKSVDMMYQQEKAEDVRAECVEEEVFLVLDNRGRIVCGRDTMGQAKKAIKNLEAA